MEHVGTGTPCASPAEGADRVELVFLCGSRLGVSRTALIQNANFFKPLEDESGPIIYDLVGKLDESLSPKCLAALPTILTQVGSVNPDWVQAFAPPSSILHAFAVIHFLGVPLGMSVARRFVASSPDSLVSSLAMIDPVSEEAVIRVASEYALDKVSPTKLIHAAAIADLPAVVKLLTAGDDNMIGLAHVDLRDGEGRTALHLSAMHDSPGCVAVLVEAGADVWALCDSPEEEVDEDDTGTTDGRAGPPGLHTPLHLAALHDSAAAAAALLDAKADVAACVEGSNDALTPLHECASANAARVASVLLRHIAISRPAPIKTAPLADSSASGGDVEMGDTEMTHEDTKPTPVAPRWMRFQDPLHARCAGGATPLHTAAAEDAQAVAEQLLAAGADPKLVDESGDTPVHYASMYGSANALTALLKQGADASCANTHGETPLHFMTEFGADSEMAPMVERLHFARSLRVQQILMEALSASGDLENIINKTAGDGGNTALHSAARSDHLGACNAVRLLVGARADLERENSVGWTPLAMAVRRGCNRVAEVLRELGAEEVPVPPLAMGVDPCAHDAFAAAIGGQVRTIDNGLISVCQVPTPTKQT